MTPLAVIFLSAYLLKTKIENFDILFCFICIFAVTLVIIGYGEEEKTKSSSSIQITVAVIAAVFTPFIEALNSILTRKLKEIPDRTV